MWVGFVIGFIIGLSSGKRSDAGSLPLFAMKSILFGRGGAEAEGLLGVCQPFNYVGCRGGNGCIVSVGVSGGAEWKMQLTPTNDSTTVDIALILIVLHYLEPCFKLNILFYWILFQ